MTADATPQTAAGLPRWRRTTREQVERMADALHRDCELEWQAIKVTDPARQVTMHMADAHYGRAHDLVRRLASADEEHCQRCGLPVGVVWTAPDGLWAAVADRPDGGGILCIQCFDDAAVKQGRFIRWVPQEEPATPAERNR